MHATLPSPELPEQQLQLLVGRQIKWLRHAADATIDEAGGTPILPDVASGGPSWTRDRAQSTPNHGWKLGASLTAPGDHSGTISDHIPRFRALSIT